MSNPLHQFEIKPITPLELMGYDVSFTNSSLFMFLSLLTLIIFLGFAVKTISLKPGRLQALAEMFYNLVADMINSTAGAEAKKFLPFIFSLFMFILFCNILGMLPFSFTVTSHIIVTFAMAMTVFIGVTIVGFVKHGLHYFSLFLPHGTPWWMAPFMVVIEMFTYLMRPVSLSIRLAANMTAGHIVMKVFAGFVIASGALIKVMPFAMLIVLNGFEIFVAVLQAYIFAILSCVYLTDAIKLH